MHLDRAVWSARQPFVQFVREFTLAHGIDNAHSRAWQRARLGGGGPERDKHSSELACLGGLEFIPPPLGEQSLTVSVGWDASDKDLKLLLAMPDQRSVGLFVQVSASVLSFSFAYRLCIVYRQVFRVP